MKLNIGCGHSVETGWVGIDNNPHFVAAICRAGGDARCHDARVRMPFPDGSIEAIYTEDMIEHLARQEAFAFLRDCRRLLTPDGVLIVSTPDLRRLAAQYLSGEIIDVVRPHNENTRFTADTGTTPDGHFSLLHAAEAFNSTFYWSGHRWLYDAAYLDDVLRRAGFRFVAVLDAPKSAFAHMIRRPDNLIMRACP